MASLVSALTVVILAATAPNATSLPTSLDLGAVRAIATQHDGRWPPLDTVARDIVESVTGDVFHEGRDPVLWLLAWTFDPATWQHARLIPIPNAELRAELQLPAAQTRFSYAELVRHPPLLDLIDGLAEIHDRKPNALELKVGDINEKLTLLHQTLAGQMIRVIPDPIDALGAWHAIGPAEPERQENTQAEPAWMAMREAFLDDDAAAFSTAADRLITALDAMPAAHRPTPSLIATELHANSLRPFRLAWIIMLIGAMLATAALLMRRRWFDALAIVTLVAGFAVLTYGLSLRWQIAGRIPAANMFESLLFLSWGTGAFGVVAMLFMRNRIVPLTASAMGALALILADCLPIDGSIRPIPPVLMDTIWMSIHVPVIMVSYSVLALAVLIAHVQLGVMALAPRRQSLIAAIDGLHYWYVFVGTLLLLAGILTGSMWAASSWGRYWGWDPKEVWSLIAFLGYMTILHVRIEREQVRPWAYGGAAVLAVAVGTIIAPHLAPWTPATVLALAGTVIAMLIFVLARGRFGTALKSVLAFWLIIMTYVGVNYVLGIGLHSYGFGTGAVVRWLFLVAGIDLTLIALCTVLRLRHGPEARAAT